MTRDWFEIQMARLLGLRFPPADTTTHWEGLRDVPEDVLEAAVTLAQRTRAEFPTPVELRQDADSVAHVVAAAEPEHCDVELPAPFTVTIPNVGTVVSVTREWKYYDERCSDSGWAAWWCGPETSQRFPWMPLAKCDRRNEHAPHEWLSRCACWESNPSLVRKRENMRRYADAKKTRL